MIADLYNKMLNDRLGRSVSALRNIPNQMKFARLYFPVLFLSPSNGAACNTVLKA